MPLPELGLRADDDVPHSRVGGVHEHPGVFERDAAVDECVSDDTEQPEAPTDPHPPCGVASLDVELRSDPRVCPEPEPLIARAPAIELGHQLGRGGIERAPGGLDGSEPLEQLVIAPRRRVPARHAARFDHQRSERTEAAVRQPGLGTPADGTVITTTRRSRTPPPLVSTAARGVARRHAAGRRDITVDSRDRRSRTVVVEHEFDRRNPL